MDTVIDGLIIIDRQGSIQAFNLAAERIFGYRPDEVIGQNVKMLMPEPYHGQHDVYLSNYLSTGARKIIGIGREVSGRRRDGSVFPMELGVNEMWAGDAPLFVGTVRDITERKDAEACIKSEAERLQTVLDTVIDGLIIISESGIIETFNAAAERIFAYKAAEVIGQDVRILMPEPYRAEHGGYLQNYLTTGEKKVIGIGRSVFGRRRDGRVFPMELGVNEMQIDGTRMFVGTIRDVSEREEALRQSREETARLKAVMDTVLDGLITIDQTGMIETFNPAAERIFGYQAGEVIGRNINMLMPDPYHTAHDGYLRNYLSGGQAKVIGAGRVVTARRKNGSVFPIELGVSEMNVVGKRLFVGTIRDITERVEAEHAAQQYIAALSRSNQELDDFAYIASHDLKEPLRGLSNNALFLKEDFQDVIGEDGNRRLARIMFLCERMERLVNDLLYFSRLNRQDLAIQSTDLNAVIADITQVMQCGLDEANARIVIPTPLPTITCDMPRTTEVFRNLITNAVKYNDKPEKIVEIGCKQDDGRMAFFVRDNGIGIHERFHSDIFRIFKRLNDEPDAVKGTGVGLTFVKKIIERHGGRIWLESELGQGTTFYFTLAEQKK
jgi:two-component system, LuxR family, sensor kinase FixL